MKPKTKFEKEIVALSNNVKPLSEWYSPIAYKMAVNHIAYKRANGKCFCLDCGCEFTYLKDNGQVVCPHCHTLLHVEKNTKRKNHQICWWNFLTTQQGYQLVRGYMIEVHQEIRKPAKYDIIECSRQYINEKGQVACTAKKLQMFWYNRYIPFKLDSDFELRYYQSKIEYSNKYEIGCDGYVHRLMKPLERCGFKNTPDSPVNTILKCLSDSHWQTLLEEDYTEVFRLTDSEMNRLWPQLKICIRHKYHIKDVFQWRDLISNLEHLNMDTHSPKYICPDDLEALHQKLIRRINKRREEAEHQRQMKELLDAVKYNSTYVKKKGKYFGILLHCEGIDIKVLDSIDAIAEEGNVMHHCVFVNKYWKKDSSLLLSATEKGERIATIEYDLNHFKVLQCRAKFNKVPDKYDTIIKMIEDNKSKFINAKNMNAVV